MVGKPLDILLNCRPRGGECFHCSVFSRASQKAYSIAPIIELETR